MRWKLHRGDCRDAMRGMEADSIDAIVCDPPYGLSFMGKGWDHGVPGVEFWLDALRVAKPGCHLVAFGGTRTYHRLACAIEDAGWEVRDCLGWLYGSGFPKSLDVSKQIDKHGGTPPAWFGPWFRAWRESQGITQKQVAALFLSKTGNLTGCVANWELGFNLPTPEQFNLIRDTFNLPFNSIEAAEREVVERMEMVDTRKARAGFSGITHSPDYDGSKRLVDITAPATDAAKQWQGWGTALKPAWEPIILARKPLRGTVAANVLEWGTGALNVDGCRVGDRWPANITHDGSEEVLAMFPETASGSRKAGMHVVAGGGSVYANDWPKGNMPEIVGDVGSASRFFYCAKASKADRDEGCEGLARNHHPTVKPTDLMRWLVRLVTPPGGLVLDPFAGSGSTGKAALLEGFRVELCELTPDYWPIIEARCNAAAKVPRQRTLFG